MNYRGITVQVNYSPPFPLTRSFCYKILVPKMRISTYLGISSSSISIGGRLIGIGGEVQAGAGGAQCVEGGRGI
jgi:hypothetical protein